jgi:hypothetical protein
MSKRKLAEKPKLPEQVNASARDLWHELAIAIEASESTRDQFAALGHFVQTFELIVSVLRDHCRYVIWGGHHVAVTTDGTVMMARWNICSLPFHHQAMTAKPLVEIWRALVIEESAALLSLSKLTKEGKSVSDGIAAEIVGSFSDVIEKRNKLVHGTWQIGLLPANLGLSTPMVEKYKVGALGLEKHKMPASFDDLRNLSKEAGQILDKLGRFLQYYQYHPKHLEHVFKKVKRKWVYTAPEQSN